MFYRRTYVNLSHVARSRTRRFDVLLTSPVPFADFYRPNNPSNVSESPPPYENRAPAELLVIVAISNRYDLPDFVRKSRTHFAARFIVRTRFTGKRSCRYVNAHVVKNQRRPNERTSSFSARSSFVKRAPRQSVGRLFCTGFGPEFIESEPYWK